MKYCPICDERYDEDIIRFCTKDGTPLVDVEEPKFSQMPSENVEPDDDFGQETVIRRKAVDDSPFGSGAESERIVIPTMPEPEQPPVRARVVPAYIPPPLEPQSNTAKTVVLTILGTLGVLGFGALLFWLLQKDTPTNVNVNLNTNLANQNISLNTNGFDSNFNFNSNANFNANFNYNANLNASFNTNIKLPTPSPTPRFTVSPTPSPTPGVSPTPRPTNANVRPPVNTQPTPLGTPRTGPRPPPLANNRPSNIN